MHGDDGARGGGDGFAHAADIHQAGVRLDVDQHRGGAHLVHGEGGGDEGAGMGADAGGINFIEADWVFLAEIGAAWAAVVADFSVAIAG